MPFQLHKWDYRAYQCINHHSHLCSRKSIVDFTLRPQTHHPRKAAAVKFNDVQRNIADLIKDSVIVGHCLWNLTHRSLILGLPCCALGGPAIIIGTGPCEFHGMGEE